MIQIPYHESRAVCSRGEAIRALCDNRDRYIQQSRETKAGGGPAELPPARNWTDNINQGDSNE